MRNELSREYFYLPDGAIDFGNGVVGPTPQDIDFFNSLNSPLEQAEALLAKENLVPIYRESRLGEFINHFTPKLPRWTLAPAAAVVSLVAVGCADVSIPKNSEPAQATSSRATPTTSESAAPPPRWYFTQGPHYDGLSNGKRYAIDIGTQYPNDCPGPAVSGSPFPSPVEGMVIHAGGESTSDYYHSIVEIQTRSGEILGSMHLANIKVKKGDVVKTGAPLGDPSCEVPPGGSTNSTHIHVYLRDIEENPVPIKGVTFTDGVVGELADNYKGYLDKNGVQELSGSGHYDLGPNKNVLGNYLQLISTGNGSFRMELRSADGKPMYNQKASIFSVKRDINGNSKPDKEVRKISSGELGILQATLPPGEYMLLLDKNDKIKGNRFSENEQRVGITDIEVRQDQITSKKMSLGIIVVNMKDNPQRPTKGSFTKRDTAQAEVCIDGLDNGKVYQIECIQLSDLDQDGIVGKSRAVFNLIPSDSYLLRYAWDDGFRGFEEYTAKVDNTQGQTKVVSGQTTEFNCLVFAPTNSNDKQPADCTARIIK